MHLSFYWGVVANAVKLGMLQKAFLTIIDDYSGAQASVGEDRELLQVNSKQQSNESRPVV